MLCRRSFVQAGAVATAGVLFAGAASSLNVRKGLASEAAEPEPAQMLPQVAVDGYGTQTLLGSSGVRFVYPAVTWADLRMFSQVSTSGYAVNLFDGAFPQGWTYQYATDPSGAGEQNGVLKIFDESACGEGASEPLLYAYLADSADSGVPGGGLQAVFTGDYANEKGQTVVLACSAEEEPAVQDLLAQGLVYASVGSQMDRAGAYAVRGADGVRIFTPYYAVSLEHAQLAPGWGFMLVENPEPEEGDSSLGFHRLWISLGEDGPAFGVQCFDTPQAQADQGYGRVPVEGVVSSDGKLIAVVPEGGEAADWAEQAPTYASWVQTAPANSWEYDNQYLRLAPVGDEASNETLVETPYYAVRFPLEGSWEFSYTDNSSRLLFNGGRTVIRNMIARRIDGEGFPQWMQFFCQMGRGSEAWDGPLAFALSDVTTPDGFTVGVAVGMPDSANPRPEDPDYEGVLALAQQYAQVIEPLPADAAVPRVEEFLMWEPLVV